MKLGRESRAARKVTDGCAAHKLLYVPISPLSAFEKTKVGPGIAKGDGDRGFQSHC